MALNIWRKTHRNRHNAGKDNVACLFSSVLTKTMFNILARTAKFKMTYVRVVLACTNSTALTGNYTRITEDLDLVTPCKPVTRKLHMKYNNRLVKLMK